MTKNIVESLKNKRTIIKLSMVALASAAAASAGAIMHSASAMVNGDCDSGSTQFLQVETVSKDVKDIHTTTDKITKRFDSINQVDIKEIDNN